MRTPQAAHLEMNAAYPEFKEGPLRLASIINGGILLSPEVRYAGIERAPPAGWKIDAAL